MTTPAIGVHTPSTTPRANRLRQPLESPFPSPPHARNAGSANDENNASSLSDHHVREITTVFEIFDPTLSGHIDVPTFEVMVRSLGFRMTQVEIVGMVEMIWEERHQQQQEQQQEQQLEQQNNGYDAATAIPNAQERRRIDLPTAIQILSQRGYADRNAEDEMQMYFRIFDHGNKGYVTLDDLKRVQNEVKETEGEIMAIAGYHSGNDMVGDATLREMIKEFDQNEDGVIDYEEFKSILEPMLSSSSLS